MNGFQNFKIKENLWNICLFLFCISLFVSKSLLSLTSFILILTAFLNPNQRQVWVKEKKVILIVSLFPLALIVNFLSLAGAEGVLKILTAWPWPLLAAPACCAFYDNRTQAWIKNGLLAGLIISLGNTFIMLYDALTSADAVPFMSEQFRLASFWDVTRWGFFLGLSLITLFLALQEKFETKVKAQLLILLLLSSTAIVLTNSRAPVLALIIVFTLLAATQRKLFKSVLLFFVIGSSFLLLNPNFQQRIKSIFAVQVVNGEVSSSHASNSARFTMWKIALDFYKQNPWFGTGFESTAKPLNEFIAAQPPQYLEKFNMAEYSYNDQHSSYISTLVQMGTVYFVILFSIILFLFFTAVKIFIKTPNPFSRLILAMVIYCFIIFIFYSSLNSYESIVFFIALAILGCTESNYSKQST